MFSKLIIETFLELNKIMTLQIQELHTSSIKKKKSTARYKVVELQNTINKEESLKKRQNKRLFPHKGTAVRMTHTPQ